MSDRSSRPRGSKTISPAQMARRKRLIQLWEDGVPVLEIAAELGSTKTAINVALVRLRSYGIQLSYRRDAYAAVPLEAGSWKERLAALEANRGKPAQSKYAWFVQDDPCVYCGEPPATVDHIVPYGKGGRDTPDNVASACRSCNTSKSDMPMLHYLLWRRIRAAIVDDTEQAARLRAA